MRDEEALAKALADLEGHGGNVATYVRAHPELPPTVVAALRAAAWIRRAPRPAPSGGFRARALRAFEAGVRAPGSPPGPAVPAGEVSAEAFEVPPTTPPPLLQGAAEGVDPDRG